MDKTCPGSGVYWRKIRQKRNKSSLPMHQKIYMNLKETIMKKTFKKLILILAAIAIVVTAMPESVSAYSKRNPFRHGTYSGGITVVSISPIQGDYTSDFVTKEISGKKRKVTDEVINIQTSTWYEGADHADRKLISAIYIGLTVNVQWAWMNTGQGLT